MVRPAAAATGGERPRQIRKKPAERSAEILSMACRQIIAEGYAAFSLRQVAEAVGIKLATLQYYYPTREALLDATIKRSLADWRRGYSVIIDDTTRSAEQRLRDILHRNLDIIIDEPETVLLFDAFAMARREPVVAHTIERTYRAYREMFRDLFREINPRIRDDDAMALATLAASHTEGLMIFTTGGETPADDNAPLRRAIDGFAAALSRLASGDLTAEQG